MAAWTCCGCGYRSCSPDEAHQHQCGKSGVWERCTCGSGGHPRMCDLHPETFQKHIDELNAINTDPYHYWKLLEVKSTETDWQCAVCGKVVSMADDADPPEEECPEQPC